MSYNKSKYAVFAVLAMSFAGMVGTTSMSAYAQDQVTNALSGGFASITTEQDGDKIVITIVKEPGSSPADQNVSLPEVPEGPIIIVPDPSGEGNGTVIVPEPAPPAANETAPAGNETAAPVEEAPPIVVIAPDNVTQVEQPSNVTVIDNDTVIVTPPTDNITEIPLEPAVTPAPAENVTAEEPATEAPATAGNETTTVPDEVIVITPPAPVDCGCPPATEAPAAGNETAAPEPVTPAADNATATEPTLPLNETSEQPVQAPAEESPTAEEEQQPPEFGGQNSILLQSELFKF